MKRMATALVTGASGFVGRALCARLLKDGWSVRAALRSSKSARPPSSEIAYVGEIGPDTDWTQALARVEIVFHLAARVHVMKETERDPAAAFRRVNALATEVLANASVKAGVQRLVFLSTLGVHGNSSPSGPVSESAPFNPQNDYSRSKLEAERMLEKIRIPAVIVRAPLVYGPDNPGNFLKLLSLVRRGLPLPLSGVDNKRSFLYVENLADALIRCAGHSQAPGQAYLARDGEDFSTPELIRRLADLMGRPARLFPFPEGLLRAAAGLVGAASSAQRLLDSMAVDDAKIRRELDWMPPISAADGLKATVDWYKRR